MAAEQNPPDATDADVANIRHSRRGVPTERISESPGRAQLLAGGMGYIARRGVPWAVAQQLQTFGGVEALATYAPLQLLILCADLIPEVSQAVWNILLLGCSEGVVEQRAVTEKADGSSEDAPDGTTLLNQMWAAQPQEAGGYISQLAQNVLMTLFSGMSAVEAVPGPEMTGVQSSWPVDTLTLVFRREKVTNNLVLDQRQNGPITPSTPVGMGGAGSNMIPMPMDRFFWQNMHSFPGDPYGRAAFAPALQPIMDYLGFIRDLTVAFHRVGMPRYDVEFDWAGAILFATDVKKLTDPNKIAAEVKRMFEEFVEDFNGLKTDDAFFHPVGTKVNSTGTGSDMPDLDSIFDIYRYRIIIGLKQNPVLMSFVEGSTETWSDIQWDVFTKALLAIVSTGAAPLEKTGQLHLRLLGKPYKVVTKYKPVRSLSRFQDAQAEAFEIDNEIRKRDENLQTQETTAQKLTGSAPVGPAPPKNTAAPPEVTRDQPPPPVAPPGPPSPPGRKPVPPPNAKPSPDPAPKKK